MSAAQLCWTSVASQFEQICSHPFVLGLADGTLPEDVFVRYLVDDAHYLDQYARVLAQLAVRAPTTAGVELLAGFGWVPSPPNEDSTGITWLRAGSTPTSTSCPTRRRPAPSTRAS